MQFRTRDAYIEMSLRRAGNMNLLEFFYRQRVMDSGDVFPYLPENCSLVETGNGSASQQK